MLATLNRSAVVVTPKQPFLDWLHAADPTSSTVTLQELQEPAVYLLPDCEDDRDLIAQVRTYSKRIFEEELEAWYTDRDGWPVKRDFKTFGEWFEYRACILVLDLCDSGLRRY